MNKLTHKLVERVYLMQDPDSKELFYSLEGWDFTEEMLNKREIAGYKERHPLKIDSIEVLAGRGADWGKAAVTFRTIERQFVLVKKLTSEESEKLVASYQTMTDLEAEVCLSYK